MVHSPALGAYHTGRKLIIFDTMRLMQDTHTPANWYTYGHAIDSFQLLS